MNPLIENAILTTDLEGNLKNLLNLGGLDPVPSNLAESDDPRLTDERAPIDGSVTNDSVAVGAGIVQSKLNLDGDIPTSWLGTTSTTAAQGDLAEYLANKGQPDGYASLDGSGKIPSAQVPTDVGTGTVTSVGLTMPAEFDVAGSPITGSGSFGVTWGDVSDLSWFGNKEGLAGPPQFYTDPLPADLIPDLDTAKVISGEFDPLRLPEAVGLGGSHASGAVPDPGDGSGGALATDYLARDMTFKPAPEQSIPYQPGIDTPTLTPSSNITGDQTVVFACDTPGVQMFYSLTSALTGFIEIPPESYISLPPTDTVWCYAAKAGYNNSAIEDYTNPNP